MLISESSEMNPTKRNTMEDVHRFQQSFSGDPNQTYLAVYDGHGGRGIVDFIETKLEDNIKSEISASSKVVRDSRDSNLSPHNSSNTPQDWPAEHAPKADSPTLQALERAYLITDMQSRQHGIMSSGATCVSVLIKKSPLPFGNSDITGMIYAANCGDARAVLSRAGNKAYRLTHDHKASSPSEISRIDAAGGFVLRSRVLGILAVARSLGDHGMKEFVIGKPFLSETHSLKTDNFVVVACDGLWDVMEDQEVCDFVASKGRGMDESEKGGRIARMLIDEALTRGSTDNISVVVGWL